MIEACVTWPVVALVLGIVALLVVLAIVFLICGGEFKLWFGDPPGDW